MRNLNLRWTPLAALLLTAVLIYLPALSGGFFFDDIPNIVEQGTIKLPTLAPAYLVEAALPLELGSVTRPLSRISFAINWYVTGMDPFAFKVVNLGLHGINAVLVWLFLYQLLRLYQTNRPGTPMPPPLLVAAVAALLWAAAPIHAHTVPYVVQRMVLLSATFSLVALIAYLQLRLSATDGRRRAALGWATLAGVSAVLAFLSKEIAILLPVYVLVMEMTLLRPVRSGPPRRFIVVLAVAAVAIPSLIIGIFTLIDPHWLTRSYSQRDFGLVERLLTQSRILVIYLSNTVLPRLGEIHFFNDNFPISRSLLSPPTTLASIVAIVGLTAAAVFARRRWPVFAFAVLWFLGGHLLESTFIPLELVFWHRNYLPSLGPLLLVAWGLSALLLHRGAYYRIGYVLVGAVALIFAGQTLVSAYTWGSPLRMAFAEYSENPSSGRANYEYGRQAFSLFLATKDTKYLDQTLDLLTRSAALDPRTMLPLHALYQLGIKGYPVSLPSYDHMLQILGNETIRSENVSTLQAMGQLSNEHPELVNFFDIMALYDALEANPRVPRDLKAQWRIGLAYFLTNSGLPAPWGLDVLREAWCQAPHDFAIRIRLLEGLSAAGYLDEAQALIDTGFRPWEKWVSVSIAYAERLIAERRAAAKDHGISDGAQVPSGMLSTPAQD